MSNARAGTWRSGWKCSAADQWWWTARPGPRVRGHPARLLLACPPRRAKRWTEADIPPDVERSIADVFDRLYELRPTTDDDGDPQPVIVPLSADGHAAWVDFYNAHGQEQAELSGDLAAAWSKLEGYAARLALVVHFARWAIRRWPA